MQGLDVLYELGEYPNRGTYELAFVIEGPKPGLAYREPRWDLFRTLAFLRECGVLMSEKQRQVNRREHEAAKTAELDRKDDDMAGDALSAFGIRPHVSMADRKSTGRKA